jgi:hypothetical protein
VVEIGITYVRLDAGGNVMSNPNSQVLNAVIGLIPPSDGDPAPGPVMATPAVMDSRSGTPGGPEKPQPAPPGPA